VQHRAVVEVVFGFIQKKKFIYLNKQLKICTFVLQKDEIFLEAII